MSQPDGSNFDYAAFARAVVAAVPLVTRVRVEPWHVLQAQAIEPSNTLASEIHPLNGQEGIILRADAGNSGSVYVGTNSMVGTSDYALAKGETLTLTTDASVWLLGSTTGQLVHVIVGGG